jgi:hypothetical protein
MFKEQEEYRQMIKDTKAWCREQWGPPGTDNVAEFRYAYWGCEGGRISVSLLIRDEADAVDFKLRWY